MAQDSKGIRIEKQPGKNIKWQKVFLHFYKNYRFGTAIKAYDFVENTHPLVGELNMPINEIFDLIQQLRNVKLMRLTKFDSSSQGSEDAGYLVNITEKGFDVAIHLEEHLDANRSNTTMAVLTFALVLTSIIQVATTIMKLDFFLSVVFLFTLNLLGCLAYLVFFQIDLTKTI